MSSLPNESIILWHLGDLPDKSSKLSQEYITTKQFPIFISSFDLKKNVILVSYVKNFELHSDTIFLFKGIIWWKTRWHIFFITATQRKERIVKDLWEKNSAVYTYSVHIGFPVINITETDWPGEVFSLSNDLSVRV